MKNIFLIILFGLLLYPLSGCDSNKQAIAPTSQTDTSTNNHTPTDTVTHKGISITLWNQPLDTIKKYTLGKWQLIYSLGGMFSITKPEYFVGGWYWTITTDSLIELIREKPNSYSLGWQWTQIKNTGDSAFWMTLRGLPEYKVLEIENDTLVLRNTTYPEVAYLKFASLR